MIKINKETAVFIVFLLLVIFWGLFTKSPNYTPESTYEQIPGFIIQFKDGITELEVRAILEKYNLPTYNLIYNWDNGGYKYYIEVEKDKMPDVVDEGLNKDDNWTDPV